MSGDVAAVMLEYETPMTATVQWRRGTPPLGRDTSCAPIFIVGCGRSGTTLLRLVFNRHSKLAIFGESAIFFRDRKYGYLQNPRALSRFIVDWRTVFGAHSPHSGLVDAQPLKDGLKETESYIEAVSLMMDEFAAREQKQVWGEKTPAHVMRLEKIFAAYPNARVIHLTRDPRAVVASANLGFGDKKFSPEAVYSVARYWQRCELEFERVYPQRPEQLILARYEDLVADPEGTVRRICEFLEVGYEPAMLEISKSAEKYAPRAAPGSEILPIHRGLLKDINTDAVEKWRDLLNAKAQLLVEQGAGDLMVTRGYRRSAPSEANSFALFLRSRIGWLTSEVRRVVTRLGLSTYWRARALTSG